MTKDFNKLIDQLLNGEIEFPYKEYKSSGYSEQVDQNLLIEEGLILSHTAERTTKSLKHVKGISNIRIEKDDLSITNMIIVDVDKSFIDTTAFDEVLNVMGYLVGRKKELSDNIVQYQLEAKFPSRLPEDHNIKYFYHVAPKIYLDKIKSMGLVPKSSRRKEFVYEQSRIYLLSTTQPDIDLPKLCDVLFKNDNPPNAKYSAKNPDDYIWFRIQGNELYPKAIYFDPRFMLNLNSCFGVFLLQNVPPDLLEIIKE